MIIDRDFMIVDDILTLYKFPPNFPWDGRCCPIQKFPMDILMFPIEISMLNPNEGRLLFFILQIGFELPKFKDLMIFIRKNNYTTLRIMNNWITGEYKTVRNDHKTLNWYKKTTKNLYEAMIKYYTKKEITNDDFLEVILLNFPKDIYDLIMNYYDEYTGELRHIYDLDKIAYLQKTEFQTSPSFIYPKK